jgi:hypothetical protein
MDHEAANRAIKDGTIGRLMSTFIEQHKPEASYFTTDGGHRTAFFVLDIKESHELPTLMEPFFMELRANVTASPVMNKEELQKGLDNLAKQGRR